MATELTLNPRLAQWFVQAIGRLLATFAILQGVSIILGGAIRWSSEAFTFALLLPGAPPSWGVTLLVAGALGLIGSLLGQYRSVIIGMVLGSVWCAFFAISFISSAIVNHRASLTGIWAYAVLSFLFAMIASIYRESRKIARP